MTRILIVDDSLFFRKRTEKILMKHQIEVVMAEDGEQAVQLYQQQKPDMVFMDITMPELDGISAVKEIVKNDPSARICMLSCMGQDRIRDTAIGAGAIDFLDKPYEEDQLMAVVAKMLNLGPTA